MARPAAQRARIAVLVVEDHEETRRMLQESFEVAGMDVRTCASAEDALADLHSRQADVVVTDLRLAGGRDGAYLAATLRGDPATAGIAVLALSGEVEPTPEVVRVVDAYLHKPVDLTMLPELVATLAASATLRRSRIRRRSRRPPPPPA